MALFYTEFLDLVCANIQTEKQWWIATFGCTEVKAPASWDCPLPSDVALKLPGADEPTILLSDTAEVKQAGYDRSNSHPLVFCTKVNKAREYLRSRGADVGPIQDGSGTQFFELPDPEGNVIEICEMP